MTRIGRLGPVMGAVGAHTGNRDNGWEIALDAVFAVKPYIRPTAFSFGWGWDDHVPFRPWPQGWWERKTPRGNVTSGFALFGFYVMGGRA